LESPAGLPPPLVADLIEPGDFVVLVIPLDKSAPKGRLILPQQQTIRGILESQAVALTVGVTELRATLQSLGRKPQLVITDSQVFGKVSAEVPDDIFLTSFSILFARHKGVLLQAVRGAKVLDMLENGDTVLISEGCTHHRQCDDIGTVKLPRWIQQFRDGRQQTANGSRGATEPLASAAVCRLPSAVCRLSFAFTSGRDFPDDLSPYKLVVHCGGCMLNEREMKYRAQSALDQNVPMTNYGILIAHINGILKRSVAMFPDVQSHLDELEGTTAGWAGTGD